ncbi:MAG: Holliday junction resolvase Hjc [Candidatus ainarchaeum sp.]|nr:Holliday junction resolvase Hjc [Candidatus ainarchaeum sp.]
MARNAKGANAERELIKLLDKIGYAVLRVAGSGVNPLPCPDVVALKNGKIIAFECKARKGNYLAIEIEQMQEEINWAKKAGAIFLIAWKVPFKGWILLKPQDFVLRNKNYMIKLDEANKVAKKIEDIL